MVSQGLVDVGSARGLDPVLRALAEPTRRRVVELLSGGERRAGDLSSQLKTSAPTMSKHLRVLLGAGVVEDRRDPDDARGRIFGLRAASVVTVQSWLDQLSAHWDEQRGAFKAHAERAHAEKGRASASAT